MQDDLFTQTRTVETPTGTFLIRPIRPGDEYELLLFFRDRLSPRSQYLFCPHDPKDPERCMRQFGEQIRRHRQKQDLAYLVEWEGAVVGYCYLSGVDRIDGQPPSLGIGLADELHGLGLGGVMMDRLLAGARALGLAAVELTHEATNERAARLYMSRGFVYTGEEEYSGPDGSRIERVMRWIAGPDP